jgi:hypothetical protein
MDYIIIKQTLIGIFIVMIVYVFLNLKEQLKVPTQCDFDECFTDYLGPGPPPGPNPPLSPNSNPLPLSRLE